MKLKPVDLKCVKLKAFIEELDEYQNSLYPAEFNSLDSLETLGKENVYFLGAYDNAELCGFCAVKIFASYGELKRLFVDQKHRGKSIAKELITELERHVLSRDIQIINAETGISQAQAIKLFKSLGYTKTGPFGEYIQNPYSIFFSKHLTA